MPTTQARRTIEAARAPLATPVDFEAFQAKLAPKDRLNVQRHLAALEADPDHAALWTRIACALMTFSPHAAKTNGQQSMQFFIADGKYRMQVFALEDKRDGKLVLYMGNVLDEALRGGLVKKAPREPAALARAAAARAAAGGAAAEEPEPETTGGGAAANAYRPGALPATHAPGEIPSGADLIWIDELDGKTPNPAPFFKDMLGWNRRALRVTFLATADEPLVETVEALAGLSAKAWADKAAKAAGK
jgi:hypothetical protein